MPVFVKTIEKDLSTNWAIIELQGDLRSHSESHFEGKFIGDLHYTKNGTPTLIIGHHLMFGKQVTLEKPLALLEKTKKDSDDTEYLVKTIVTKKIIFKVRPKPIVGKQ